MFFEAIDFNRTLDLNFNLMNSFHFESNFKRTINCPTTPANVNEPSKRITCTGVTVEVLE